MCVLWDFAVTLVTFCDLIHFAGHLPPTHIIYVVFLLFTSLLAGKVAPGENVSRQRCVMWAMKHTASGVLL